MNDFNDYSDPDVCPAEPEEDRRPRCKYCGSVNVYWEKVDDQWRLHEAGTIHQCQ
jgi:hypothetical protein